MAKAASDQNVRRDEDGPDYDGAILLIRGQIRSNQSESQSLAQDNSTLYKRVDKQHGVHRGAAKDFAKIDQMAEEKRTDYVRSLLGLLNHAHYDNFNDLVDQAQAGAKKAAAKPAKAKVKAPDATGPAGANGNIALPDPDPEIEKQKAEDAEAFEGDNVHKLPVGGKPAS